MKKHKRERNELRAQVENQREAIAAVRLRAELAEADANDWAARTHNARAEVDRTREQRDRWKGSADYFAERARRYRAALQKIKRARNAEGHRTVERLKTIARDAIDGA